MLFLPAAALCWLGSALAAMATQLVQEDLTLTRRKGESVSFSCGGTDQCDGGYVYWYQKKENETFRVIFDIDRSNGNIDKSYSSHPQINDFSAEKTQKGWEMKIENVSDIHSASYYCGCGKSGSEYLFGSGTKLYVTGDPVVQPVVSVYPAASSAQRDRKGFLLCLASGMFPPEVQISWKRLEDGGEKDLTSGEQLELREPNRTASILLVDREPLSTSRYRCSVQHEGGPVEAPTTQEVPGVYPPTDPEDLLKLQYRVKLLCLLYSVLIVKSLVYCCGLSLLMVLRTKGPAPS